MRVTLGQIISSGRTHGNKIAIILGISLILIFAARTIVAGGSIYFALILILVATLFIYLKQIEFFILLLIILNQEIFFLFPQGGTFLGRYYFQDYLYVALLLAGAWYVLNLKNLEELDNSFLVISLLVLVMIGIFYAFLQGQPLFFGLSAAKSYFFILFYFIFMGKRINTKKLFNLIIVTGVILLFVNNIQYLFFGDMTIFHYERVGERVGSLRFLVGDKFNYFSSVIAFGEYLKTNKKVYLFAFIYMAAVITLQGQVRAAIWGFMVTVLALLYLKKIINFSRVVILGIPIVALFFLAFPLLQSSRYGRLYELTRSEFADRGGNIGVRLAAYDYYIKKVLESPFIGKGIWSDGFTRNNPEDVSYLGLHLSDIGFMSIIFHFGALGLIWLIVLFRKIFRQIYPRMKKLKTGVEYGIIGYFFFNFATMLTLNNITSPRSIFYFALVLAIISQALNPIKQDVESSA